MILYIGLLVIATCLWTV